MFSEKFSGRTVEDNLPWNPKLGYGGWGGEADAEPDKTPVVFVHGNGRTADDWTAHRSYLTSHLREDSYTTAACWAITFTDAATEHHDMAEQLDAFIDNVLRITGADEVDIVAHSLGVTGTRYWLEQDDSERDVRRFIAIAGANSGLPILRYVPLHSLPDHQQQVCQYLRPKQGAVTELSTPCDDVEVHTIRGTHDVLFLGNPRSPRLDCAEKNHVFAVGHDGARESTPALRRIYSILTG